MANADINCIVHGHIVRFLMNYLKIDNEPSSSVVLEISENGLAAKGESKARYSRGIALPSVRLVDIHF